MCSCSSEVGFYIILGPAEDQMILYDALIGQILELKEGPFFHMRY